MIIKQKRIKCYFWALGAFTIGSAIYISIYNPDIASATLLNKVLLISVTTYTITLMVKNIIASNYNNSSSYEKARTDLFFLKVMSVLFGLIVIKAPLMMVITY